MKKLMQSMVLSLVMIWIFPALVLSFVPVSEHTSPEKGETLPYFAGETMVSDGNDYLPVLLNGEIIEMKWEDYLTGVLLGELPGYFHFEAKKAQAVVARTYAMKVVNGGYKHENGAVCADSGCCQAYISPEKYMELIGDQNAVDLAREAVCATERLVITYQGNLIDATYFSCSGGMTEDAIAVWGTDIPYLQSVESPGEEQASVYTDTVQFTKEEFSSLLGADLKGVAGTWFGKITYTEGGGVETIEIGGKCYRGTDLRMMLGLRSTAFSVTAVGNSIIISTRGFGHRVGMSQYGAEAMAGSGADYIEILKHYYQGIDVVPHKSQAD